MTSLVDTGDAPPSPTASPVTVRVGAASYQIAPSDAPAVIGRSDSSSGHAVRVPIADDRISREHLVLYLKEDAWFARPEGRNGTFVDGQPQTEPFPILDEGMTVMLGNPFAGIPVHFSTLDPDIVYVGAQVAQRRAELDLSQRVLAANKVINAGALIAFEKGRSWPRQQTQERLEDALGWPPGRIAQLRREHAEQSSATPAHPLDERTMIVGSGTGSTTVEATFMADTIDLALGSIRANVDALPPPSSGDYQPRVGRIIGDLARLEKLASKATRGATGAEAVFRQLSAVRLLRRRVMLAAAATPHATLGQRLFAARTHSELSAAEAAAMVGISDDDVLAAEAGTQVPEPRFAALQRLLSLLG